MGKSSIINCLTAENDFQEEREENQELIKPVLIKSLSYENRFIALIDTSAKEEAMEDTKNEIRQSHTVIVVYDMSEIQSILSLA